MALVWEIFWIALIVLCPIALVIAAVRENGRRKAAQQAQYDAMSQSRSGESEPEAMDNLDDFGGAANEPDFDFPKS